MGKSEPEQLALWATQDAIRRARENADPDWLTEAHTAVLAVSLRMRRFTTDDVWDAMAGTTATTHEPRALGSVMRKASRDGFCAPTGQYLKSRRRACHTRPLRVWKSLLFA